MILCAQVLRSFISVPQFVVAACFLTLSPSAPCGTTDSTDQESRYYEHLQFLAQWENSAPHPIRHAGYYSRRGTAIPFGIVWLDNDVAIFPGLSPNALATSGHGNNFELKWSENVARQELSLFEWNTRTGAISRRAATISDPCLADGDLTYLTRREGARIYRIEESAGGSKTATAESAAAPRIGTLITQRVSRYTCKTQDASRDSRVPRDHRIIALRPRDGYLDRGPHFFRERPPEEPRFHVTHYPPGAGKGFPLWYRPDGKTVPLEDEDIALDPYGGATQYSAHLNAYLLNGREIYFRGDGSKGRRAGKWYASNKSYVFLLSKEEKLTRIDIPKEMARHNVIAYFSTRKGIFGFSHGPNASGFGASEKGAGYGLLLDGERVEKILIGNIYGIGISPNGCKIAVAIARGAPVIQPVEIKSVDVCKRRDD